MARQQVAIILDAELPLDDGETQVADLADGAADNTQCKTAPQEICGPVAISIGG